MANIEAVEIKRQSRALSEQTENFKTSCTNIIAELDKLSDIFKGTQLESIIRTFSNNYATLRDSSSRKYIALSETMFTWAQNTIDNELATSTQLNEYRDKIGAMLDVLSKEW